MKIDNIRIYGLEESLVASGYPMKDNLQVVENYMNYQMQDMEPHFKRGKKLGSVKPGTGHDCYLKGIITQFDLTAPQYFWMQWERYHFQDIISSQSKMHKLLNMNIESQCNEYVNYNSITNLERLITNYKKQKELGASKETLDELYQGIVSNVPMGLELTARVTTNYLQNKTVYKQRKNHKLKEWHYYCEVLAGMPYFLELIGEK